MSDALAIAAKRPLPFAREPATPGLRRTAIALTLVIQAVLAVFVLSQIERSNAPPDDDAALQVEWIRAERPPSRDLAPPVLSTAAIAVKVRQPPPAVSLTVSPTAPEAIAPAALRTQRRLQDQLRGWLDTPAPPVRSVDSWRGRPAPRLPGREEAFVEGIHTRDRPSPQQRVQAITGMLFGARDYDCADVARKMRSDITNTERRQLIEEERRMCGGRR